VYYSCENVINPRGVRKEKKRREAGKGNGR
jgi:hypothetical protein